MWSRCDRPGGWLSAGALVVALGVPVGAHAQAGQLMDIMQQEAPPFSHSSGLYAFTPPGGWFCQQAKGGKVECKTGKGPAPGTFVITYSTIEGRLDSELMAFNEERRLQKLPHFKKTGGGRLVLGGAKASVRSFTFDYQGNTEYPVAVEELYVVTGGKAIRLHFETMARAMPAYGGDLRQIYDTLGVAEVDEMGQVITPAEPRSKDQKPGRHRP